MYDLTQLEHAGFEFTPLERLVFENPSFRYLYRQWPVKWGSFTTGLAAKFGYNQYNRYTVVGFDLTERERITPNGAANLFDEFSRHARSVVILAAKIAREASWSESDMGLVQSLSLWLDGINDDAAKFRWVRFQEKHQERLKREERTAEVAVLSQGTADVVVLLLNRLAQDERQAVRAAVETDCIERGIFGAGDDQTQSRYYHLPWPHCILCNGPEGRSGGRHCDNPSSIVLVDCGDVLTILRGIPAGSRRIVKPVRFKVSKSTFSDRFQGCVGTGFFPQFVLFSLNSLSVEEQQKFRSELENGLKRKQQGFVGRDGYFNDCRVIAPDGRQKVNALLLAGVLASWHNWRVVLEGSEFANKLRSDGRIRVDLVGD